MWDSKIFGILFLLVIMVGVIHCEKNGKVRDRRVTSPRSVKVEKALKTGSIDCFDGFDKCRKSPKCKAALHGMKKKCKVVGIKCNTTSDDLLKCANIMDTLFLHAFTEVRCNCGNEKMDRCFDIINKVYANPCFATIKMERKRKELAEIAKNTVREKSNFQKILEADALLSHDVKDLTSEVDEFVFKEDDVFFGDEGFHKPRPFRTEPPKTDVKHANDEIQNYIDEFMRKHQSKPPVEKEETTTPSNDFFTTQAVKKMQNETLQIVTLELKNKRSENVNEDKRIYEPIAISLGIVFGATIMVIVIFLLIKSAKGAVLYKKGKKATSQSDSGA